MGFSIETSVSAITVFLQGIFSFFSPCVLPLIPLYMGYLAGGAKTVDANGNVGYQRGKVFLNTVFFIVGVSFAFFALGFGFTTAGRFLSGNRVWFARIGGCLILIFGLYQLGVFGSSLFGRERRLSVDLGKLSMNPFTALIMGFTFSFAWTPCVGPALTSVLIMAGSASSSAIGYLLIGVYTMGFILPFLAVGLFTGEVLTIFRKNQKIVKYTVKVSGALLVVMGVMMLTGWMNGFTSYLSGVGGTASAVETKEEEPSERQEVPKETEKEAEPEKIPAPDFTLKDQYGQEHTLSDYKGKVVFLNFWASWCGPCKQEMPEIQALYEENAEDLVVLGVANPRTEESPYNQDVTEEELTSFLSDNGYTYPTVMDTTGEIFYAYGINSFPTTFMIDKEGNVFGYISGSLTREIMDSIIKQTMEGERE